jgi:type II secretory pathway component PulF
MPVLSGLQFIHDQTKNQDMQLALKACMVDISEGREFHYALGKHPHIFDQSYVQLMRAGKISNKLELILDRICEISEIRAENIAKINPQFFIRK